MSRESDSPTPPPVDNGFAQLGVGFLCWFGLWIAYGAVTDCILPAHRIETEYVPAKATVVETGVGTVPGGKHGERFRPMIRVRFEAGGAVRQEWCPIDWSEVEETREEADAVLRGYPVGKQLEVRYDPAHPERVAREKPEAAREGRIRLAMACGIFCIAVVFPAIGLLLKWSRHRRLEQSTGRVVGGDIREAPTGSTPFFQPILRVEYDRGSAAWNGTIEGTVHATRPPAEAELRSLLSTYRPGEQRPIWFDPRDRQDPTFEPLTQSGCAAGVARLALLPVIAPIEGVMQLGRWLTHAVTTAQARPPREIPAWRRALMIVAALLTIGLSVRYVFWQDYSAYCRFEPVTGEVLETVVEPDGDRFEPRVKFAYVVDGQYYERLTHMGWYSMRRLSKTEAETVLKGYPVGEKVLVWYDPGWPLMGILKRYLRPHLYVILIPPVWLLIAQTRRLIRGE
jgi:hypothetical protein